MVRQDGFLFLTGLGFETSEQVVSFQLHKYLGFQHLEKQFEMGDLDRTDPSPSIYKAQLSGILCESRSALSLANHRLGTKTCHCVRIRIRLEASLMTNNCIIVLLTGY